MDLHDGLKSSSKDARMVDEPCSSRDIKEASNLNT